MNLGGVIRLNKTGVCVMLCALLVLFIYMLSSNSKSTAPPSVKINLKHLLRVAIKAAENGGTEVDRNKNNLNTKQKGLTKEGLQDSVTSADYLSHCAIMKTLKHAYPTLNVISEEQKVKCEENQNIDFSETDFPQDISDEWTDMEDITVWIDPLDATYEYIGKLYDYVTTMVCVAVKGRPVIGVIHKPFSKSEESHTFWAWHGFAKSNNLNYVNYQRDNLKVIVSMSHAGKIKEILAKNIKNVELVSAAGAGYKSLEVALGNVDAYIHITAIKKWDICAGNAIINSMGGKMITAFDKVIDYKDVSNVQNQDGLVAAIKNHDLYRASVVDFVKENKPK